jgi:hypothetical protein
MDALHGVVMGKPLGSRISLLCGVRDTTVTIKKHGNIYPYPWGETRLTEAIIRSITADMLSLGVTDSGQSVTFVTVQGDAHLALNCDELKLINNDRGDPTTVQVGEVNYDLLKPTIFNKPECTLLGTGRHTVKKRKLDENYEHPIPMKLGPNKKTITMKLELTGSHTPEEVINNLLKTISRFFDRTTDKVAFKVSNDFEKESWN